MSKNRSKNNTQQINKKYPWWFNLFLVIIPLAFLVILEITLQLADYGREYKQWMELPLQKRILEPDVSLRYFYNINGKPQSPNDVFDQVKPDSVKRIFVLGGSSAAGYPYLPNGSFAKYIRKSLKFLYGEDNVEVINCAMTAINTYALRDLLPGIIEQNPDAVIIYAGHNEYYGALGVGSSESIGDIRPLVNLSLQLQHFKTYQMMRNFISWTMKKFSNNKKRTGTLMARMAEEQSVEYKGSLYNAGVSQFDGNMKDMIEMLREHNIPLLIGSLACNLKDQPPFISLGVEGLPKAMDVYNEAQKAYSDSNFVLADSLFRYAKDLDALKFRAPSELNRLIKEYAKTKGVYFVNIDSTLAAKSKSGIVDNELMVDHLHPTLNGYKYIGEAFVRALFDYGIFPPYPEEIMYDRLWFRVNNEYRFNELDTTISDFRIKLLKADWPFASRVYTSAEKRKMLNVTTFVDTLAELVIDDKINWEKAHRMLANRNLAEENYGGFLRNFLVITDKYPNILEYYNDAAKKSISKGKFNFAQYFLERRYKLQPDYFSAKWLGNIELNMGYPKRAIIYLEKSKEFNTRDPQVYYNLTGAYAKIGNLERAIESVNKCIELNPNYPDARRLKNDLIKIAKQQKEGLENSIDK